MSTKPRRDRDKERSVTTEQFIAALRRVADALEAGKSVLVRVRGEQVRVPRGATVSIEHEREGADEELEFQFRWAREEKKKSGSRR